MFYQLVGQLILKAMVINQTDDLILTNERFLLAICPGFGEEIQRFVVSVIARSVSGSSGDAWHAYLSQWSNTNISSIKLQSFGSKIV